MAVITSGCSCHQAPRAPRSPPRRINGLGVFNTHPSRDERRNFPYRRLRAGYSSPIVTRNHPLTASQALPGTSCISGVSPSLLLIYFQTDDLAVSWHILRLHLHLLLQANTNTPKILQCRRKIGVYDPE